MVALAGWMAFVAMAGCSVQQSQLLAAVGGTGSTAGGSAAGSGGAGATAACPVELVGWAAVEADGVVTTTGGGDATPQRVTSIDELRTLAGDGTARVLELSGTFTTGVEPVDVASNKTLVGVDANATIVGGITIRDSSNIVIRNLNVQGGNTTDAIGARGSHHLWLDHLNVRDAPDGNLDITSGCNYVTVSFTRFWYSDPDHSHRLCSLVGGGSTAGDTDTGKNKVTYHHNWFADLADQAMPRILFGQGHVFNSYYHAPGNLYCIGVGSFASVLIENNYFQDVNSPHRFADSAPAYITARGNIYDNPTGSQDTGQGGAAGEEVTPFTEPPYEYALDPAADVPDAVTRCAGPQ